MNIKNDCHNETGSCEEVVNIVLLNREKRDNSSLLGQTINSAILDSGASTTVCGKKWLDCFLETLPEDSKKKKSPTKKEQSALNSEMG